jgi:predicted RNA methylase
MLKPASKKSRYPKHPFDLEHGTDTGGLTPGPELKTGHAHDRHNTAYYGIAPSLFRRLIKLWKQTRPPHLINRYTFIDIGAGKGRAMLLASEFDFKEVIGVELHPALATKCRRNMRIWNAFHKKTPMRLVKADATEFIFPPGPCVVYLFNPFGAPVLRRVLKQMAAQFKDRKDELDILYVNHEHEAVLKKNPAFKKLWRGLVPMSSLDAIVDLQILNSQLDGEYGSTGDESCSIWRFTGAHKRQIKSSRS